MLNLNPCKTVCALLLLCLAVAVSSPAQTFTSFGNYGSGAALIQSTDGNLYGTGAGTGGLGAIIKVTPAGSVSVEHNFCAGGICPPGSGDNPQGPLLLLSSGNLYGTTLGGGLCVGCGTIFQMTPAGTVFTLHQFAGGDDGEGPRSGLIQGSNGNLQGTTWQGGGFSIGSIFKMNPSTPYTLTTLNELHGPDGESSIGGLVQGTDGNFYGTASQEGANGYGTVFKITPTGTLTVLHNFEGTDGDNPQSTLVLGTDGNFYGTTINGGSYNLCAFGCGTVFKITPEGVLTVLHSFDGTDGENPQAGLMQATDGNFYGTTSPTELTTECTGIACGTIFQITPSGTFTTLHTFTGPDGSFPTGGLMQATNGTLYGATSRGGTNGVGAVYSLSMGLGPIVETAPISGAAGRKVIILGTDLTGATAVTFNGTAATFTVVSATEITTTVPSGATTGTVEVTTPGGTLSSNIAFVVP